MDDVTAKRCRALLSSALDDEPSSGSLQRTAAALGLPMATVATATTLSNAAAASSQASTAAANAATTKAAAVTTAAQGAGSGWSVLTFGGSATAKLVIAAVFVAGAAAGVAHLHHHTRAPKQSPSTPAAATGGPDKPAITFTSQDHVHQSREVPLSSAAGMVTKATGGLPSERVAPPIIEPSTGRRNPGKPNPATKRDVETIPSQSAKLPPTTLEQEIALLGKARDALIAAKPHEALQWLDAYQRQFSSGLLMHEASVLRSRARAANRNIP